MVIRLAFRFKKIVCEKCLEKKSALLALKYRKVDVSNASLACAEISTSFNVV